MINVTFSELRKNARLYFDQVAGGETLEVYRHGKPVALLSPIKRSSCEHWRGAKPLNIAGVSLSKAILAEREQSSR